MSNFTDSKKRVQIKLRADIIGRKCSILRRVREVFVFGAYRSAVLWEFFGNQNIGENFDYALNHGLEVRGVGFSDHPAMQAMASLSIWHAQNNSVIHYSELKI